jgi:hypothetical protein
VLNAEDKVEELNDRTLCVATTAILHVRQPTGAVVENYAVGETSISHILTASEEWSYAVVENVWITTFIHSLQETSELIEPLCK